MNKTIFSALQDITIDKIENLIKKPYIKKNLFKKTIPIKVLFA